jgi:hypothetical protein
MCHSILQKHIKRQIISLPGGFQLIADLNAYHRFLGSLRASQVTAELAHLKMLAHVYVVEDATDLAQIVRDVTRYGGAYRPEVCSGRTKAGCEADGACRTSTNSSNVARTGRKSRRQLTRPCIT